MIESFTPVRPDISVWEVVIYGLSAFLITLALTPWFVSFLRRNKIGKQLRVETVDGREASMFRSLHQAKFGTPTMGGILIWLSITITVVASRAVSFFGGVDHSLLQRGQVYLPLFALISYGILGAFDDYYNIRGIGKKKGLDTAPKLFFLVLISLCAGLWFHSIGYDTITIPLFHYELFMGWWYVPFFMFVVVSMANAVNFTDGLDGLAGGLLVLAFAAFAVLSYLTGLYVLSAFCVVCVGAIAAFLWHNVPPALFFMGDTGSLALGSTLGVIALMIDQALVLPIIGFVFVLEIVSVVLQLTSKKLRGGKKIFRIAPIHHHFEALGWGESKVTMRMWIIGTFSAVIGVLIALT